MEGQIRSFSDEKCKHKIVTTVTIHSAVHTQYGVHLTPANKETILG